MEKLISHHETLGRKSAKIITTFIETLNVWRLAGGNFRHDYCGEKTMYLTRQSLPGPSVQLFRIGRTQARTPVLTLRAPDLNSALRRKFGKI